jgi:hypothetical protein
MTDTQCKQSMSALGILEEQDRPFLLFATLDLTHGFRQMPLEEQFRHLIAISIPGLGYLEWVYSAVQLLSKG